MKRIILLIVFCVMLLSSSVFAGVIMYEDVKMDDSFVVLKEGDAVALNYEGKETLIIIRKLQDARDAIDISLFNDIEDENALPFYTTLKIRDVINVDSNKDGIKDYLVGLYDITGDSVTLLYRVADKPLDDITGGVVVDIGDGGSFDFIFYGLLVLALVLFGVLFKKRKTEDF